MKTIFSTIACMVVLYLLPINARHIQERYLPVFGEGMTIWHLANGQGMDDLMCYDTFNGRMYFIKDMDHQNRYISPGTSPYPIMEVSEDNSKLWGWPIYPVEGHDKILLMDLNMNVGDDYYGHIVSKVYYKDGRKHIEFLTILNISLSFCNNENSFIGIGIGYNNLPLMFIEGFGPNALLWPYNLRPPVPAYPSIFVNSWIFAQYRDGEYVYGAEGYPPSWEWYVFDDPEIGPTIKRGCVCERKTGIIKETILRALLVIPNPAGNQVQVKLPEIITGTAHLTIRDLMGKVVENRAVHSQTLELDISQFAPATYIIHIDANNYRYVGKIIKK